MKNIQIIEYKRAQKAVNGSVFINKSFDGSFAFGVLSADVNDGDLLVAEPSELSLYDFMGKCSHLMAGMKKGLTGPLFEGMQHVLQVAQEQNPFDVKVSSFRLATAEERNSYMLHKTMERFSFHLQKSGCSSDKPAAKAAQTSVAIKIKSLSNAEFADKIIAGQRDWSKYKLNSEQQKFVDKQISEEKADRPPYIKKAFGKLMMVGVTGYSISLK